MLITIGNIFESKAQTLVNTINCVGVMGKGIALEFKKRYPQMFEDYVILCSQGEVVPGQPYYYSDLMGTSILNFPTKDHWRSPSKLSYIVKGLDWFVENYKRYNIKSIAFPPLGCGNGGLNWETVGPLMYQKLKDLPIEIEIYAPFGTKKEQLTIDFLENNVIDNQHEVSGIKYKKINDSWYLILYVVQALSRSRYSLAVGRTIFQKICYVLTRSGVDTGFSFTKGYYGPYSSQIDDAIIVLSNANLLKEMYCGRMMKMEVSNTVEFNKSLFTKDNVSAVKKTIDLFSRVKNTEQAELIATVLFAYDFLSQTNQSVSDIDVYYFVMEWKKRWNPYKKDVVCETIQNLTMLDWIDVSHSDELEYSVEI